MNNNENIIELTQTIEEIVKENGTCVQLYGSWNKECTEEERVQLSAQLRDKGIETIKLYDYAELYVMADMDSTEKEKILAEEKERTPMAFEEVAAEFLQHSYVSEETIKEVVRMLDYDVTVVQLDDKSDDDDDE